jgi:dihydropteroate synthase
MKRYIIKESVKLHIEGEELTIMDSETGFFGKGNKHAYAILKNLKQFKTKPEILELVKSEYDESQFPRIEKSLPNIIQWGIDRNLILTGE